MQLVVPSHSPDIVSPIVQRSHEFANANLLPPTLSGRDSVSVIPATGKFSIELKAGTWKVVVEATDANKNTSIENIVVLDNQFTDVGVIKLP